MRRLIFTTAMAAMSAGIIPATAATDSDANLYEKDGILYGYYTNEDKTTIAWVAGLSKSLDLNATDGVITIPAECNYGVKVISIADGAFAGNKELKGIIIPNTIEKIATSAFAGCDNFQSLKIDAMNPYLENIGLTVYRKEQDSKQRYSCLTNVLNYSAKDFTIEPSVVEIADSCVFGNRNIETLSISGNPELSIGSGAFQDCDALKNISISDCNLTLGENAFYDCNSLSDITLAGNTIKIGVSSFADCNSLSKVIINTEKLTIDKEGFFNCSSLRDFDINASETEQKEFSLNLGNRSLACIGRLRKFYLPEKLTMGWSVFAGTSIDNISIDKSNPDYYIEDGYLKRDRVATDIMKGHIKYPYTRILANFEPREKVVLPCDIWVLDNGTFLNCPELRELYLNNSLIYSPGWTPGLSLAPKDVLSSAKFYTHNGNTIDPNIDVTMDAFVYFPEHGYEYSNFNPWSEFTNVYYLTPGIPEYSGVEEVADQDNVRVSTSGGTISIEAPADIEVRVYSTDGVLLYTGNAGCTGITAPGIYIVVAGTKTVKVVL